MIIIGRPINGIPLNGLEYLLDGTGSGETMKFDTKAEALEFVRENVFPDTTDEQLEDYFVFLNEDEVEVENSESHRGTEAEDTRIESD